MAAVLSVMNGEDIPVYYSVRIMNEIEYFAKSIENLFQFDSISWIVSVELIRDTNYKENKLNGSVIIFWETDFKNAMKGISASSILF